MKKIYLISLCLLIMVTGLVAQGLETFANFDYTGTGYVDGSFVGNDGITWNYIHATGAVAGTNDNSIDGNGMILRRSALPSRIFSGPIPNGIGNFSVQMRKAYTGAGDRQLALFINNTWVADSQIFGSAQGSDPTIHTFIVDGVNIEGNVVIEIRNIQGGDVNRQVTIDNISWTTYGGGTPTTATPSFNPATGLYFNPVQVSINCSTPAASIFYTTDGSIPTPASTPYTAPFTVSNTTTVKAMATATGFLNSNIGTAVYSFPQTVSNLETLRSMPPDGISVYHVAGEVVLTFQQTYRNQKYVQDNTAAILIDDFNNVISTTYNLYDGITGLTGRISPFGGMLQFVPVLNSAVATSANNVIVPLVTNYNQLIENFDDYEARVIKIMNVTFSSTGNFVNGISYPSTDGNDNYNFRTTFYDVDYIGTAIPTVSMNITGIPNSRTDGEYFSARFLSDFEQSGGGVNAPTFNPPGGNYTQPINVSISCSTPNAIIYYTTDGSVPSDSSMQYTAPIAINSSTTLKAIAYLTGETPSAIVTAIYSFPATVANISQLRQQPTGATVYTLTGEVFLTFKQSYRNQKYIQDADAAILIDDFNGVITTNYNVGDGITGISGTLNTYGNMLQFIPLADAGAPTSTGNVINAMIVNASALTNNFEMYESRLIRLENMIFYDQQESFANGTVYGMMNVNGMDQFSLRTSFYDVDYIGTEVPDYFNSITGIANSTTNGDYITPRNMADLQIGALIAPDYINAEFIAPNGIQLTFGYNGSAPWALLGYRIYKDSVLWHTLDSSEATATYNTTLSESGNYTFYVKALYPGSFESDASPETVIDIVSSPDDLLQLNTSLKGNYPNPFNPNTTISFSLKSADRVSIEIFNLKGQLVKNLVNAAYQSGEHQINWDGKDDLGNPTASGIYYYKMRSGSYSQTRKMLMLK